MAHRSGYVEYESATQRNRVAVIFFAAILLGGFTTSAETQQREAAAATIERIITESGVDAAIQILQDLQQDTDESLIYDEEELDALGRRLLEKEGVSVAFWIFNLNTKVFPESWRAWEHLGEGYYLMGMRVGRALESYQKALEVKKADLESTLSFERLDAMRQGARSETTEKAHHVPGQPTGLRGPYLGQSPPGRVAKVFAPGIVSTSGNFEYSLAVSTDGDEIYFNRGPTIVVSRLGEAGWTSPVEAPIDGSELHFSADGSKMFYNLRESEDMVTIGVTDWPPDGTAAPRRVFPGIYATSARSGAIYYTQIDWWADHGNVVRAFPSGNGYTSPEALVGGANSPYAEVHPVIAPDESYVIFDSTRPDGMGWADLYISFRRPDGTWGEAVSMGQVVNNRTNNICPSLSPDGKFLFFTSNNDIYWVSTEIVESFRNQ